jgi:hypothetical protein
MTARQTSADDYPGGWFGESWGAPVCDPGTHRDTPVGWLCVACLVAITAADHGLIMPFGYERGAASLVAEHFECFRRGLRVAS